MKTRRHHNNKGLRQIKRGKTYEQVKRMARRIATAVSDDPHAPDPRCCLGLSPIDCAQVPGRQCDGMR